MRIAAASPAEAPQAPTPTHHPAPASRPAKSFTTVLDEGSAVGAQPPAARPATTPAAPARGPAAPTPTPTSSALRAMLTRAVGAEKQVDALLEAAARGKT